MSTLSIAAILLSSLTTTLSDPSHSTMCEATPDNIPDGIEISLFGDIVSVEDNRWKIATMNRSQYVEWDNNGFLNNETAEYQATQKGMTITVKVSGCCGFASDQISNVTVRIEGEVHADSQEESEMIIAFGNTAETKYFSSIVKLDNNDESTIYPMCGDPLISGNISADADATDFRWYTVGCPKNLTQGYPGRYSADLCEDIANFHNGFPVIGKITNDPAGSTKYQFINHNENGQHSDICEFPEALNDANGGFIFYMAGEGGDAKPSYPKSAETFYISKIIVTTTSEDLVCDESKGEMEGYNGFILMAYLGVTIYTILLF